MALVPGEKVEIYMLIVKEPEDYKETIWDFSEDLPEPLTPTESPRLPALHMGSVPRPALPRQSTKRFQFFRCQERIHTRLKIIFSACSNKT